MDNIGSEVRQNAGAWAPGEGGTGDTAGGTGTALLVSGQEISGVG